MNKQKQKLRILLIIIHVLLSAVTLTAVIMTVQGLSADIQQELPEAENSLPEPEIPEKYKRTDIAQIFIDTEESRIGTEYTEAVITIIDKDGGIRGDIIEEAVLIKIRGNSTASAEKKPYTFRFEESRQVLGMNRGKRWVLLANAFDKTLLRNKLILDFAIEIGLPYTSKSEFVDVWLNGEFRGNYLITEPVTDGNYRVPVYPDNGDFLFEVESERSTDGVTYISTAIYDMRFKFNAPENPSDAQINALSDILESVENAISSGDYSEYSKLIDVPSFVDFFILLNYFKDVDAEFSSTRYFVKNGKIFAGPPWDFDLSSGNINPRHGNPIYHEYCNIRRYGDGSGDSTHGMWADGGWYTGLLSSDEFYSAVTKRYNELSPMIENLYSDNELGKNKIDMYIETYGNSMRRNYSDAPWTMGQKFSDMERYPDSTLEENVEYLRNWLKSRHEWLSSQFTP